MIQKPKGYENAKAYTEQERLPIGGYVLKIMGAEVKEYTWGNVLVISFDIAEGEHKGFYAENYRSQTMEDKKWKGTKRLNIPSGDGSEQDNRDMSIFKTAMNAIEDSNPGFHWDWDESNLKGKLVGAVFNNKEYDFNGRNGFYTNCYSFKTVEDIRNGKFKIPKDSLLKNKPADSGSGASDGYNPDDYEELEVDGDLPF